MIQAIDSDWPEEWRPGLEALRALPEGGMALLVGAIDCGKTTFATLSARALAAEGGPVAVIDTDIGQGEIGPPGTVGVAWATPEARRLHELKAAARFFVGAFTPASAGLELLVASVRAAAWARANGAKRILVDTTGYVAGGGARRLKIAKAQSLAPDLLVGLARDNEITGLLAVMQAAAGVRKVIPLATPATIGRKTTSLRGTRRLTRLSRALEGAQRVALPLNQIITGGALLGAGEPLTPELARWTGQALHQPVAHAELQANGDSTLSVFLSARVPADADWERRSAPVAQHFGCQTIRAMALPAYTGALIGLSDASGRFLALGRWEALDTERGEMIISAPPPATTTERVRFVQFGRVRLGGDGAFQSEIRPGEI